jgi:hypothetical protein
METHKVSLEEIKVERWRMNSQLPKEPNPTLIACLRRVAMMLRSSKPRSKSSETCR